MSDSHAGYVEIWAASATRYVEALADSGHRAIRSARDAWEVLSRPYDSTGLQTIVAENFDRAGELATLGANAVKAEIEAIEELNEVALDAALRWRDAYLGALRAVLEVGASNLSFAQQATAAPIDAIARRFEEYSHAGAGLSVN